MHAKRMLVSRMRYVLFRYAQRAERSIVVNSVVCEARLDEQLIRTVNEYACSVLAGGGESIWLSCARSFSLFLCLSSFFPELSLCSRCFCSLYSHHRSTSESRCFDCVAWLSAAGKHLRVHWIRLRRINAWLAFREKNSSEMHISFRGFHSGSILYVQVQKPILKIDDETKPTNVCSQWNWTSALSLSHGMELSEGERERHFWLLFCCTR